MVGEISLMDEIPAPYVQQSSGLPDKGERLGLPTANRRLALRRIGTLTLAIAGIAIAGLFAIWFFEVDFGDQSRSVIRAYATEHRQIDLRFPGAGYRPFRAVRPPDEGYDFTDADLAQYEEELKQKLRARPGDSETLFALAEVCLLRLQPLQAIDILERLRLFSPKDAKILGALAYGNYLLARRSNETRDLLRSTDLYEAALEVNPDDPVLLFNAGTVAQRAKLVERAKERYTQFLAIESDTGWAAEVRLRLRDLQAGTP
jgi:tetratricopeptide (TPR) repeat protein